MDKLDFLLTALKNQKVTITEIQEKTGVSRGEWLYWKDGGNQAKRELLYEKIVEAYGDIATEKVLLQSDYKDKTIAELKSERDFLRSQLDKLLNILESRK